MKPELISFKLCPFVQRSVIILLEKGIAFDITYIDIKQPPDWFLALSPFGKVPVLRCGETTLLESAVINEYIDETHPPRMHPADPLRRAQNRAWIEFGSQLNMDIHGVMMAADDEAFRTACARVKKELARVESQLGAGPYLNGAAFSLADAAYAPTLMRLQLIHRQYGLDLMDGLPRLQAWAGTLAARDSVQHSVVDDFATLFCAAIAAAHGPLAALATSPA
ncbi:MAG: glutathione S-transferase family protein [Gammaproteobacteria bacterium]|nr:glutathione S-transferase family protein [Gammaproteobacteria bacterium]